MSRMCLLVFFAALLAGSHSVCAQSTDMVDSVPSDNRSQEEIAAWFADLYTMGVDLNEDSLIITPEVMQLLRDEDLRAALYPEDYRWEQTVEFLEKQELKRAFWFMINHYLDGNRRDLVMESIHRYEEVLAMDRALLSAFYTYAVLDPKVSSIGEDGSVTVQRPDLLENKLEGLRALLQERLIYLQGR